MINSALIIKDIRINMCLDQGRFAKLLGITRVSVCNYEAGKRRPRLSIIKKMLEIAKEQGMTISVKEFLS